MPDAVLDRRAGQLEALTAWIASPDARAAARSELATVGLRGSGLADELLADVWMRVVERIRRDALADRADGGDPTIAYARRSLRNAALDLLRVPAVTSLDELLAGGWEPGVDEGPGDPAEHVDDEAPAPVASAPALVDDVRLGLFARLPDRYVAADRRRRAGLGHPRRRPGDRRPRRAGAQASPGWVRRHLWAGLAYAGQDRCFVQPETGAVRERRSRAVQRVEALVRDEIERAVGEEPS